MTRAQQVNGPAEVRFWAKVDATGICWDWTAAKQPSGYGRFALRRGKRMLAHRWAYEYLVGPIPDGLVIDHLCRNRACVNPDHMEPVSQHLNVLRGGFPKIAGRHNLVKTHCPQGHPYDAENTYVFKRGRGCKACRRELDRDAKRRQRTLAREVA